MWNFARSKFTRLAQTICWLGVVAFWGARVASAEVTIAAFRAQANAGQIKIFWTTASERKNWAFNLERSTDQKTWQRLGSNPTLKSQSPCIQNVMGAAYEFTDADIAPGVRYFYRLQAIGQPCGDANAYHDEIISALTIALTATPTATRTATPTATVPIIVLPTPLATRSATPTIIPSRAPSITPTRIATQRARAAPSATRQNTATSAPTAPASPVMITRIALREDATPSAPAQTIVARDWSRAIIFGAAILCGGAIALVIVIAILVYARPRQ